MLKVEKLEGEYYFTSSYDPWLNVAIISISESVEFKTFVLEDFISANIKIIQFNEDIKYKKISESLTIISGENFKFLLNDNIYKGTITLVPERFQSFSAKTMVNTEMVAQDYKITIDKEKIEAKYRNPQYTLKLVSFLIYRKIGILPSELLIEKLSILLKEAIPSNFGKLELKLVNFSRYFLPNKVLLSIEVIIDNKKNYYLLTYKKGKWSIKSINLTKGSINFIHKLLIEAIEYIKNILASKEWGILLSDKVREITKFIREINFLRYFLITLSVIIGVYLILKIKIFTLLFLLYILWIIYKRTCLFLVFRKEV